MADLDIFIEEQKRKSPFLKITDEEPVVGIYKGAKLVEDTFNPGEKVMQYTLEVDGIEKTFKSKSMRLAQQIKSVGKGDEIEVKRSGEGFKTKWYVTVLEEKK